jgi:hypothetical protein
LRNANRLQPVIAFIEEKCRGVPNHPGLPRLFGYACVVTGHAPSEGLKNLSQLWNSSPKDGYVLADYAAALVADGPWGDAENLFARARADSQSSRRDRRAVLDEYAKFLDRKKDYPKAHDAYRDLLRYWPHELHNYRRYAASLNDAAGAAKASGSRGAEDACFQEVQQVLRKLLEIASHDQWAADTLQRVQHRMY